MNSPEERNDQPAGPAISAPRGRPGIPDGSRRPMLSVVLPIYNERANLEPLAARLVPVLETLSGGSFEVVFIDDGSDDGSAEMLDRFHVRDQRTKVIHLSRNFGHQAALQAGLDNAVGEAVILMDADLQDPPEVLERFVQRWREGSDVVYGVRAHRREGFLKRTAYAVFYRTMKAVAEVPVPLHAGDFCLMDRRVVEAMASLPERNRFLRGLRSWVGFHQTAVAYDRAPRHAGIPKYTLLRLVRLALAGYVGFSAAPLRAAAWLGFLAAASGLGMILWIVASRLQNVPMPQGWASTLAVILFVGGAQLVTLGVIGEYLSRVYDEVRQRPSYIVRSRVGFEAPGEDGLLGPEIGMR